MKIPLDRQLAKMRRDWDERAKENARYFVASQTRLWTEADFFRAGQATVKDFILTDMGNICQGKDPQQMKVIEIGCGAARVTRALGDVFGEVHAVDVSGEMVRLAQQATAHQPHVHIYQNNGMDLQVIPDGRYDFAFSVIVFQHIPSRDVIENYVREVRRLLRRGALFKFQVQGDLETTSRPHDTWLGAPFSDAQAVSMAQRCGFEPRHRIGAGEQYFWLWFFKK